jgi:hypothetical protein
MNASLFRLAPDARLLEAQRHVLEILVQLLEIDQRLYEISETLPLSALYINMEEGTIPCSGFARLYLTLEQVQGRHLKPAIEALLQGRQISHDDALAVGVE